MKIEYEAISGYTTKAYVSWVDEDLGLARGVHKHSDDPVWVEWDAVGKVWREVDPTDAIEKWLLLRLQRTDCHRPVKDLFAELRGQR